MAILLADWLARSDDPAIAGRNLFNDEMIDFKDVAVLLDHWGEQLLWP